MSAYSTRGHSLNQRKKKMLFREHAADLLDMSLRKVVMICVAVALFAVAYFVSPLCKLYKF